MYFFSFFLTFPQLICVLARRLRIVGKSFYSPSGEDLDFVSLLESNVASKRKFLTLPRRHIRGGDVTRRILFYSREISIKLDGGGIGEREGEG